MRHRFGRRSLDDPLAPVKQPTWLVLRGPFRDALEFRELAPGADLRASLASEWERLQAAGWVMEPMPMSRASSVFFCSRDGQRCMVGIERYDPRLPLPMR